MFVPEVFLTYLLTIIFMIYLPIKFGSRFNKKISLIQKMDKVVYSSVIYLIINTALSTLIIGLVVISGQIIQAIMAGHLDAARMASNIVIPMSVAIMFTFIIATFYSCIAIIKFFAKVDYSKEIE